MRWPGHAAGSMAGFAVRGWCPGALRPMPSGDGLVVRVRPRLGRFSQAEVAGIARAALAHGSGVVDFTSRANLQIRGVRADVHGALVRDLDALGLVDATAAQEAGRNIILSPFANAEAIAVAMVLQAALPDLPLLPGKFGFAVDCGAARVLADVSADIRVERAEGGGLILRAAGLDRGWITDINSLTEQVENLVQVYLRVADGAERMATVVTRVASAMPVPDGVPVAGLAPPEPGLRREGALVGFGFGQTDGATLAGLAALGPIRVTPWRMVLVAGLGRMPELAGLIGGPGDPLRRVVACTGAPGCPQALAATRPLARALAAAVPAGRILHVSGCAKGCAHPGVADLVLVGAADGFAVVRNGTARDGASMPVRTAQALAADPARLGGLF